MVAVHRYLIADPVTDQKLGYVPASISSYSRRINTRGPINGTIPVVDAQVGDIVRQLTRQPLALYAERIRPGGRVELWWGGLIWATRIDRKRGQATACEITGATFDSYPDSRHIWEDLTFDAVDRGQVVVDLWEHLQTRPGHASIGLDTPPAVVGGEPWSGIFQEVKNVTYGEAMAEVADIEPAFETTIDLWVDPDGTRRRQLRVGAPLIGDQAASLLVCSPATVVGWTGLADHTTRGTHGRVRGAQVGKAIGGEVVPIVSDIALNATAEAEGRLRVDVTADYDTEDQTLLGQRAAALVTDAASIPSVTVRLPDESAWTPGLLGNTGRVWVRDPAFGAGEYDRVHRVIGISVAPAQRGRAEEVTFEFQPEDGAA